MIPMLEMQQNTHSKYIHMYITILFSHTVYTCTCTCILNILYNTVRKSIWMFFFNFQFHCDIDTGIHWSWFYW